MVNGDTAPETSETVDDASCNCNGQDNETEVEPREEETRRTDGPDNSTQQVFPALLPSQVSNVPPNNSPPSRQLSVDCTFEPEHEVRTDNGRDEFSLESTLKT